jgi:hypothetical protein
MITSVYFDSPLPPLAFNQMFRASITLRAFPRLASRAYATEGSTIIPTVISANDSPTSTPGSIDVTPSSEPSTTTSAANIPSTPPSPDRSKNQRRQKQRKTQSSESSDAAPATVSAQSTNPQRNHARPKQTQTERPYHPQPRSNNVPGVIARRQNSPPHLLTLADLSTTQIANLLRKSAAFKKCYKDINPFSITRSLSSRTIALMFSKRSTRTRVASETATNILGGSAMFLGSGDVQLGVNESLEDTAKVVGSMVDGIMARVGEHDEVEASLFHYSIPSCLRLRRLWRSTPQSQSSMLYRNYITPLKS